MTQINAEQNFQRIPTWGIYQILMLTSPACQTGVLYFSWKKGKTGDPLYKVCDKDVAMLRYESGFTLIELLVVITLISLSITLAVPSWEQISQKRRLTNATEQVASLLSVAQSEAQKRNLPISLAYSRTGNQDWCVGANEGATACDCTITDTTSAEFCSVDGLPRKIEASAFQLLSLIEATDTQPADGDSFITFDPVRGILEPAGDRLQFTFESSDGRLQLRLVISPTGLLTICNSGEDRTVGGYPTCVS